MPVYLAAEHELNVGQALVVEAPAQEGTFVMVFEDDGDTGYCTRHWLNRQSHPGRAAHLQRGRRY